MFRSGIFMGHPQRLGHGVEAPLQEPTLIPTPTVASNVAKISQSWSGPYYLPAGEVADQLLHLRLGVTSPRQGGDLPCLWSADARLRGCVSRG
jgi:hypothetical protein